MYFIQFRTSTPCTVHRSILGSQNVKYLNSKLLFSQILSYRVQLLAAEIFSCSAKIHTPPFTLYHCSWLTAVALQTFPAALVFKCGHKTRIHQCNESRNDSCHCPRLLRSRILHFLFFSVSCMQSDSKTQGHGRTQDGKSLEQDCLM